MEEIYRIKDRLREALQVRGMTAAELSKKSKVDKGSISRYLSGEVIPKSGKIGAMAKALNVSPAWLLGYDLTMEGDELPEAIRLENLTEVNKAKILAYYQGLLDSQGD